MNPPNIILFKNKLNTECLNKNKDFFCEWTENDIEPGYHRTYCSNAYNLCKLCSSCDNTLIELKIRQDDLDNIITRLVNLEREINNIKKKMNID